MADLILRRTAVKASNVWALELRRHDCIGPTEYDTLAYVSDEMARQIVEAGAPFFLHGRPDQQPAKKESR